MYFGSFPILIKVFYCISIFIILFSNLFNFSLIFSILLYVLFTTFNISSINISIFLDSILCDFYIAWTVYKGIQYMISLLIRLFLSQIFSSLYLIQILLSLFYLLDTNFLFLSLFYLLDTNFLFLFASGF